MKVSLKAKVSKISSLCGEQNNESGFGDLADSVAARGYCQGGEYFVGAMICPDLRPNVTTFVIRRRFQIVESHFVAATLSLDGGVAVELEAAVEKAWKLS